MIMTEYVRQGHTKTARTGGTRKKVGIRAERNERTSRNKMWRIHTKRRKWVISRPHGDSNEKLYAVWRRGRISGGWHVGERKWKVCGSCGDKENRRMVWRKRRTSCVSIGRTKRNPVKNSVQCQCGDETNGNAIVKELGRRLPKPMIDDGKKIRQHRGSSSGKCCTCDGFELWFGMWPETKRGESHGRRMRATRILRRLPAKICVEFATVNEVHWKSS